MDCRFVKNIELMAFNFSLDRSSIFYLLDKDYQLKIIEENLYTGMLINQFIVPLRQKRLETDNYLLTYNRKLNVLILTLSCRLLIYSLADKALAFVSETSGKNPYYITSVAMSDNAPILFFSAAEQRNVYCVNIEDCLGQGNIQFTKLKIPPKVEIFDIKCFDNKLVAACNDKVLRIWNTNSFTNLRAVAIDNAGDFTCVCFSKDGGKMMAATTKGFIYVWDGKTLGSNNNVIMNQKISERKIVSICWFHYGGQYQSKRFIVLTEDGNVKLYSFSLEKTISNGKELYVGKAIELCSIYTIKTEIGSYTIVMAHPYSNHICFNPGRIFYLVDYNPILYYPVVENQYTHNFESLIPNNRNEIYWQRETFFVEGLEIKRLKEGVQKKLSLNSVLEYQGLKILKMEIRPLTLNVFKKVKFLISYYLGNITRVLLIYNVNLKDKNDIIEYYKEMPCSQGLFLGNLENPDPLILLLNEDKQSVSVMLNYEKQDRQSIQSILTPEQQQIYTLPAGELINLNLNIKIQKVYKTPIRNGYAILYRSENVLRFSKNRLDENALLDFQLLQYPQYKIDCFDILIDIVWCNHINPIGAVVCLDKIFLIDSNLNPIRTVKLKGLATQAQWQGFTLFITTKSEFLYVTVEGSAIELFSLETQQDKYLVSLIMVDRIVSASRSNQRNKDKKQGIQFKTRYFNLMEPLVNGYLAYCDYDKTSFEVATIKKIIESFVPYYKVSTQFIRSLNRHKLTSFSKYLIELNPKCYETEVKLETFCSEVGLQTITNNLFADSKLNLHQFWKPCLYSRQKNVMLVFYNYIEASRDKYYKNPPQYYLSQLLNMVSLSNEHFVKFKSQCQSIVDSKSKIIISTNFGEKPLVQNYKDELNGQPVNMIIQSFHIDSVGQWIGLFSNFVEAKVSSKQQEAKDEFFEQPEGEFNDLITYYRFDQGKGQTVEDLSDYENHAVITNFKPESNIWILLDNDPLEIEDKWGKKCPPQYSLKIDSKNIIERSKSINYKPFTKFTIQIWVKPIANTGLILSFGDNTSVAINNSKVVFTLQSKEVQFIAEKDQNNEIIQMQVPIVKMHTWTHIALIYQKEIGKINLFLNCMNKFEANFIHQFSMPFGKILRLGSNSFQGEITQFRLWKTKMSLNEIKDGFRSPLSIVAEKRKRMVMKIKEKKKKPAKDITAITFDADFLSKPNKTQSIEQAFDFGFPS